MTDLVYHISVLLGGAVVLALVLRLAYSISCTVKKLEAETALEQELKLLAEHNDEVRRALAQLDSEITTTGVRPESYTRACEIVADAAKNLKRKEQQVVFEGTPPPLPYLSKIVSRSLQML